MQRISEDRSQRVVVRAEDAEWVDSPYSGVTRCLLERIGGEVAIATSLVRFAPGSRVPEHAHDRGEELFVLEGILRDEHGSYPERTYLRSPWGTSHSTYSQGGATVFVKHRQVRATDRSAVMLRAGSMPFNVTLGDGVNGIRLQQFGNEETWLERWMHGATLGPVRYPGGSEFYVLEGELQDDFGVYPQHTWIRMPRGSLHQPSSPRGCVVFAKRGHLEDF